MLLAAYTDVLFSNYSGQEGPVGQNLARGALGQEADQGCTLLAAALSKSPCQTVWNDDAQPRRENEPAAPWVALLPASHAFPFSSSIWQVQIFQTDISKSVESIVNPSVSALPSRL